MPPAAAGVLAAGAEAEDEAALGGAAALVVAATAGLDATAGVDFLLLQPAMPSPATAEIARSLIAVLFMHDPLYWDGRKAWLPCVQLVCGAQHQLLWRTTYAREVPGERGNGLKLVFGMDLLHRRDHVTNRHCNVKLNAR